MDGPAVSRCVAVAAHGKRCQQTPFRGGPYCWHHTQSRKVWAPSRSTRLGVAPDRPLVARPAEASVQPVDAHVSDDAHLAELARFLDTVETGILHLEKRDGLIVAAVVEPSVPVTRRVRRAAG